MEFATPHHVASTRSANAESRNPTRTQPAILAGHTNHSLGCRPRTTCRPAPHINAPLVTRRHATHRPRFIRGRPLSTSRALHRSPVTVDPCRTHARHAAGYPRRSHKHPLGCRPRAACRPAPHFDAPSSVRRHNSRPPLIRVEHTHDTLPAILASRANHSLSCRPTTTCRPAPHIDAPLVIRRRNSPPAFHSRPPGASLRRSLFGPKTQLTAAVDPRRTHARCRLSSPVTQTIPSAAAPEPPAARRLTSTPPSSHEDAQLTAAVDPRRTHARTHATGYRRQSHKHSLSCRLTTTCRPAPHIDAPLVIRRRNSPPAFHSRPAVESAPPLSRRR